MYEEPYRWIEAVANRRNYLDDQFIHGSPLVGLSFSQGVLLLTFNRGTPKIYEIYDRVALGGMGHPADLEKLRFVLLDMAHAEGFQRSPSDVTAARLLKNGLAPVIKPAFEEIMRAPYLAKILLAEVGKTQDQDRLFSINYDGMFAEHPDYGILAASAEVRDMLAQEWQQFGHIGSLERALEVGLRLWGQASLIPNAATTNNGEEMRLGQSSMPPSSPNIPDETTLMEHIRQTLHQDTVEGVLLDRESSPNELYRSLKTDEIHSLLPQTFLPPA